MAEVILKLNKLTKTYIMGDKKNAKKAQQEIQKLYRKFEVATASSPKDGEAGARSLEVRLDRAQELFAAEKYEESYELITGKPLKKRPKDQGVVVRALNGVSLEIEEGELVAIMGPSGSGKSTLLNMLGLLDQPSGGQMFIKGENVGAIRDRDLPGIRSSELGFVFQSFNLVPTLTALENVMLPLKYAGVGLARRKEMAKHALERVKMGDRLQHTANELSGGQRQRVAIARSIVNEPAIIFGDELTGELDSKMTAEMMRLIVKLNKHGQTIVIVTHNPDVAKVCNRTITMRDGKIAKVARRR